MDVTETSRIDKSKKNVSIGLIATIVITLVSFVNRTFFVKYLGADYLGLDGLFTEVITMLSLAELGVGMAINYSLYKPLHDHDYAKINQIMWLFRRTYNIIAIVVFALGLIALPFIHGIVKGTDFTLSYVRIVFFLYVVNTSVSYLFSYNTSFITADQKQYIVSIAMAIMKVIFAAITILTLVLYQNFIIYIVLIILQTLASNIFVARYVKKKYPYIRYDKRLPKDETRKIFGDIKNIFIKRVSGVVTSSTTNILISTLVNTIQVGFYSNYNILFYVVRTVYKQLSNGVKASIGDLNVADTPEHCIFILRRLTFLFYVFAIVICTGLLSLIGDFIELWLGKEYVMANIIIGVAIFNLYIEIVCEPLWQYLEVSGLFKQDRNIAILGSTINLTVAIILGHIIGMVGIFMGTICSQLIQLILKSILLFNKKFSSQARDYILFVFLLIISFAISIVIVHYSNILVHFEFWLTNFIVKGLFAILVAIAIVYVLFNRTPEFHYSVDFIKETLKKKIGEK